MYIYADTIIGQYMEAMDKRTTLIVCSDHGFQLGALQDDPSKVRDMRRVSEQYHNPEGILYMYGNHVKPHSRIEQAKITDLTPTLLALAGVPAALDMPGRVLTEALDLPLPGPSVATYEGAGGGSGARAAVDKSADPEILEHLRSLGYLGGGEGGEGAAAGDTPAAKAGTDMRSTRGETNIAAIEFEAGRYAEAVKIYTRLIEEKPDDATLHTSLAGALGAMGKYDEAEKHLVKAIKLQPLNVEAYHNRAVILEHRGEKKGAVDLYKQALRYSPQYEPSRKALVRLTGSADVNAPRNDAEKEAFRLAQTAADSARRGDYPKAMKALDDAEKAAPKYALVHQYRSNVAYLMGDLPAAIKALQKGLALEPDNALFQANLKQLQKQQQSKTK
jgi:tetratricopeptide (TPR) repeat protein